MSIKMLECHVYCTVLIASRSALELWIILDHHNQEQAECFEGMSNNKPTGKLCDVTPCRNMFPEKSQVGPQQLNKNSKNITHFSPERMVTGSASDRVKRKKEIEEDSYHSSSRRRYACQTVSFHKIPLVMHQGVTLYGYVHRLRVPTWVM